MAKKEPFLHLPSATLLLVDKETMFLYLFRKEKMAWKVRKYKAVKIAQGCSPPPTVREEYSSAVLGLSGLALGTYSASGNYTKNGKYGSVVSGLASSCGQ